VGLILTNFNIDKPILRWTIGNSDKINLNLLSRSIKQMTLLYAERFELFVCFNGDFKVENFEKRSTGAVKLLKQEPIGGLPYPRGCTWKLYPPRLNIQVHEIFIDHDFVLVKRMDEIEHFLNSSDKFLCIEDRSRAYGPNFDEQIPQGFEINSGLFGLPPGFDMGKQMSLVDKWSSHFDDQGFIAKQMFDKRKIMINRKISTCFDILNINEEYCAYHFMKQNRKKFWRRFKMGLIT
jgi:hypothetical protein